MGGPSLPLALPTSGRKSSVVTPSSLLLETRRQKPWLPAALGQQCRLSHHQLLLTGSAIATALGTLGPPSLETDSDSENPHSLPCRLTDAKADVFSTVCTVYPLCPLGSWMGCCSTWRFCCMLMA